MQHISIRFCRHKRWVCSHFESTVLSMALDQFKTCRQLSRQNKTDFLFLSLPQFDPSSIWSPYYGASLSISIQRIFGNQWPLWMKHFTKNQFRSNHNKKKSRGKKIRQDFCYKFQIVHVFFCRNSIDISQKNFNLMRWKFHIDSSKIIRFESCEKYIEWAFPRNSIISYTHSVREY